MPRLDETTYRTLLEAARKMRAEGHVMTAGYGGMDVVSDAARHAGLSLDVNLLLISREQAHGVWDAFHGREATLSTSSISL